MMILVKDDDQGQIGIDTESGEVMINVRGFEEVVFTLPRDFYPGESVGKLDMPNDMIAHKAGDLNDRD